MRDTTGPECRMGKIDDDAPVLRTYRVKVEIEIVAASMDEAGDILDGIEWPAMDDVEIVGVGVLVEVN